MLINFSGVREMVRLTSWLRRRRQILICQLYSTRLNTFISFHYVVGRFVYCVVCLLSATTEAKVKGFTHNTLVRAGHLTSCVRRSITTVVVKRTHYLSIFRSFALSPIDGNFSITVWIGARGTNFRAVFWVSLVLHHHLVWAAPFPSAGSATSTSCCSRHVQRLPRQVERRVLVIASWEEALRQTGVAV